MKYLLLVVLMLTGCSGSPTEPVVTKNPVPTPGVIISGGEEEAKKQRQVFNEAGRTYKKCVGKAMKTKRVCGYEKCYDAYVEAVNLSPTGITETYKCEQKARMRKLRTLCVRDAMKIKDDAVKVLSAHECLSLPEHIILEGWGK